jgi:hypothetical protein
MPTHRTPSDVGLDYGPRCTAPGPRLRERAIGVLALAVAALLGVGATTASALIVRSHASAIGYERLAAAASPTRSQAQAKGATGPLASRPLEYHGGPVMPSNTDYAIYWDPAGAPEYPAGYESGLDRYFEDVAQDSGGDQNVESVLVQYKDSAGEFANYSSHFGGALIDTDPYPASGCSAAPICLTEEQLRAEITKYVEGHKLAMDLQHLYFLLTPPGVESCIEAKSHACSAGTKHASYCSYHGYIQVTGTLIIVYTNNPYVEGTNCDNGEEHPNGAASDATIGGGLAHEYAESVTDPELNAWYDSKGEEVADKCRTLKVVSEFGEPLGKAPDGSNYNQVINGDLYWYQQMWSNEAGACKQRTAQPPQPPTVTKVTPKSGPTAGGTAVTITGANFTEPTTVKFGGVSATGVTVNSPTSLTAISPSQAKAAVDVTVTTSVGTSAVTKKDHFKYKS